ncbi:MAG: DUF3311 domain-containing protein [Halobacteriota archaeon]
MNVRSVAWATAFALLVALAIPWFLWGSSRVIAGLPVWLWWHIAWMLLAAVVFRSFTRRAWGLWIVENPPDDSGSGDLRGGHP